MAAALSASSCILKCAAVPGGRRRRGKSAAMAIEAMPPVIIRRHRQSRAIMLSSNVIDQPHNHIYNGAKGSLCFVRLAGPEMRGETGAEKVRVGAIEGEKARAHG